MFLIDRRSLAGSASLRAGQHDILGLMRGTGGVAVYDLAAVPIAIPDGPPGGRRTTDRAGEPEAGS